MKIVVFIALIIGLILGPGYLIYCTAFSGSPVKSYMAYDHDINQGQLRPVKRSEVKWNPSESFTLDPSMNPIKITAEMKYLPVRVLTREKNDYNAKLINKGNVVWEKDFALVLRKGKKQENNAKKIMNVEIVKLKKKNLNLKTFSIDQAGEYKLDFTLKKNSKIAVSNIKVIIKRNVKIPQKGILIVGFALLVLGIVGGIVVGKTT